MVTDGAKAEKLAAAQHYAEDEREMAEGERVMGRRQVTMMRNDLAERGVEITLDVAVALEMAFEMMEKAVRMAPILNPSNHMEPVQHILREALTDVRLAQAMIVNGELD